MPSWISTRVLRPRVLWVKWVCRIFETRVFRVDIVRVFWPCVIRILRPLQFGIFWIFRFLRWVVDLVGFIWLSLWLGRDVVFRRKLWIKFGLFWDLWNVARAFRRDAFFLWLFWRGDKKDYLRWHINDYRRILFCWEKRSVVRKAGVDSIRPDWRSKVREILVVEKRIVFEGVPIRIEEGRIIKQAWNWVFLWVGGRGLLRE